MGNKLRKVKKDQIHTVYDVKEKIGTGSFADVYRAIRKDDKKVFAIKTINKSKLQADELAVVHDEVDIMYKVDHENCVRLYDIFETSKKLYLVMELLDGGELFDRIVAKGSYSEKEAAQLIRDLASALAYLHGIGIVHRDLKPENLIYASKADNSKVKITDFGLAKFKDPHEVLNTACGTPGYVAPEVLKSDPYGSAVDMWSLGVILYILLCGFPPFYHENTAQLYKQIKRGDFDFPSPYWDKISKEAKNLVKGLLTINPVKRMTAAQVLQDRWIVSTDTSSRALGKAYMKQIRRTRALRKLRKGIQIIVAVNRLVLILEKERKKNRKGKK